MADQIMEILVIHYRLLSLAGAGVMFLTLVNRKFRRILFQSFTTILLIAGILISYALITDLPATRELSESNTASLAMAQMSRINPFETGDRGGRRAIP